MDDDFLDDTVNLELTYFTNGESQGCLDARENSISSKLPLNERDAYITGYRQGQEIGFQLSLIKYICKNILDSNNKEKSARKVQRCKEILYLISTFPMNAIGASMRMNEDKKPECTVFREDNKYEESELYQFTDILIV